MEHRGWPWAGDVSLTMQGPYSSSVPTEKGCPSLRGLSLLGSNRHNSVKSLEPGLTATRLAHPAVNGSACGSSQDRLVCWSQGFVHRLGRVLSGQAT
jgi:hypothetical protein